MTSYHQGKLCTGATTGNIQAFPDQLNEHLFHIFSFVPDRRCIFDARRVCGAWKSYLDSIDENSELWRYQLMQHLCVRREVAKQIPRHPAGTTWRKAYQTVLGPTVAFASIFKRDDQITSQQLQSVLDWLVDLAELSAVDLQLPFPIAFSVSARGYT